MSADLSAKAKYSLKAKVWEEMQTHTSLGKVGREYSLIKNASSLLEKPLNAKAAKELMETYPTNKELLTDIATLQQQAAKAAAKGKDLTAPKVHIDAGGKLVKTGGVKTIPMHRIATEQQVKDIADQNAITVTNNTLDSILKKYGYVAKMQGTDRIKELK